MLDDLGPNAFADCFEPSRGVHVNTVERRERPRARHPVRRLSLGLASRHASHASAAASQSLGANLQRWLAEASDEELEDARLESLGPPTGRVDNHKTHFYEFALVHGLPAAKNDQARRVHVALLRRSRMGNEVRPPCVHGAPLCFCCCCCC